MNVTNHVPSKSMQNSLKLPLRMTRRISQSPESKAARRAQSWSPMRLPAAHEVSQGANKASGPTAADPSLGLEWMGAQDDVHTGNLRRDGVRSSNRIFHCRALSCRPSNRRRLK